MLRSPFALSAIIALVPPLLFNAALRSHWTAFVWAFPLLLIGWTLLLLVGVLFACHIADIRALRRRRHSRNSLASLPRLAFLTPAAWSAQRTRLRWARQPRSATSSSSSNRKRTDSSSLDRVIDDVVALILRDFVSKWHTPLAAGSLDPSTSDSAPEFTQAVEHTIQNALGKVALLVRQLDYADLVVRRLMPRITTHIHSYRKAEADFRGSSENAQLAGSGSDQTDLFLARKFENGRLHPAVGDMSSPNTKPAEQAFLRSVCARLLQALMPYPESESASVHIIVRELLSCTVLFAIIEAISDPDFWNNLLEQKAGAVIHEQILVSKLRDALDKQETLSNSKPSKTRTVPFVDIDAKNLLPWTQEAKKPDQKSFEAFLRSIKHTTSLLEVRRIKNDVAVQIRKTKSNLERVSDDPSDASRAKLQSYLHRLETAYAVAEQKIAQLGSEKGLPTVSAKASAGADPNASRVKLHDVLLNPSSLSFFMEFMDRRKRSVLVQFWLLVESFKNPLEDSEGDAANEHVPLSAAASASTPSTASVQTLREDLRMFDNVYYSSPFLNVSQRYIDSARRFLANDPDTPITALQVWQVRRDVLRAQRQIYDDMEEEDWPSFRGSDLFLKAAQDLRPNPHLAAGLASSVGSLAAEATASFANRTADASEGLHRPAGRVVKPNVEHADLFGTDKPMGTESKQVDLFGDTLAGSRSKASAKSDNLDILIGGRTQHAGPDGRTPLFREDPLFDEQDDGNDDQAEEERGDNSSDFIQVDKVNELHSVLQSIIDDDIDKTRRRPAGLASSSADFSTKSSRNSDKDIQRRLAESKRNSEVLDGAEAAGVMSDATAPVAGLAGLPSFNMRQELGRMDAQLEKLEAQTDILEALARKAELTGARSSESRLLAQSIQAVRRESRDIRWQRNQLEQQVAATQLNPGQTKVSIQDTMISLDPEGKEYAVYLIEIGILEKGPSKSNSHKQSQEAVAPTTRGWIVGRRYSEFWSLHQALKERFAEVRALESEFPGKRLVGLVHAPFVDARKAALERYLQALVKLKVACESDELRIFLSQTPTAAMPRVVQRASDDGVTSPQLSSSRPSTPGKQPSAFPGGGLVKTLFKGMTGVAEGLDDLIGIGPSMLDVVVQRLSMQMQTKSGATLVQGIADIDMVSQAMDKDATPAELREAAGAGTTYWTEPICDLFTELFELHEKNNWLRRQAIVILLQQLFGSTVERKIRETFSAALSPPSISGYVLAFKASLWPNGVLKEPTPPRTRAEKDALRENANSKLASLIPELAANFVGRENARKGTRRVFAALQNKRLNKHLIYSLLDVVVEEVLAVDAGGETS
ncbi:possible intermediate filament protein [Pseudozyma hubeiensis SY62]|uniref:Possible intermediate filament protein n=1 Tax=Pseudozyma hubeiensis (strain SY62) TaxID=1305764 RepID=R9P1R9_PSEHS|nr:possible intermediate filament protein [Pseudozyma hubeiensis SY62]GAC95253.1 possible intermediate filament protein [Pseudozyma hubeiensis SY62]